MSYVKIIKYGDNLEIYQYEHLPMPHKKGVRDPDKEKPTEDEKYEKRQDNIYQIKRNFRRLVSANLGKEKPLLLSLTYAENMQDIHIAYRNYKSFVQALKYKFGKDFKYIAVPEFQKRGAVHFHALFWRLPKEINRKSEIENRTIAKIWGHGFVDIKETDGDQKISGYLAKYMAKAFTDKKLKNQKAYVSSWNVERPVVESDTSAIYYLFKYTNENDLPVVEKEYLTRWLGKGHFRLFKITNDKNL
ncbi:MAG: hypothetical protein A2431_00570 [Candidatus Zambryskibacteria bacterium RIFOXYC1_FULL_39_10]|uniref:Replication-associated protein ORF2/G2P domain-containing protein n=1 Tax=Candidatus Zambryskibacteria bacterium RIFOXYC1_FULL_39_10 TaxID=1802779 RepID=A0A1G2UZ79_9BACT|nr:MAG: hypothetical protein A2431_00570 [Candidatus Zambryskibacteria bacterium RIFOXYC1_FULL_39_10]OHB15638.1 MAG: hypothetical protein A2605_02430 [Candidatus Zambryskibacteria bacterium RIFOXYD1_FULL_39_35]